MIGTAYTTVFTWMLVEQLAPWALFAAVFLGAMAGMAYGKLAGWATAVVVFLGTFALCLLAWAAGPGSYR